MNHTQAHECAERVWSSDNWRTYPCQRKATIERDGKWWCWQHDPEYVAEKARKLEEEYQVERKADKAKRDREERAYAALDVFEEMGLNPEAVREMQDALSEIGTLVKRIISMDKPWKHGVVGLLDKIAALASLTTPSGNTIHDD